MIQRTVKMLNLSQEAADTMFGLANIAAIAGGILVVVGTAGIFWIGSVREHCSDQRLQANELATATANKEAAVSQERNTVLKIELEKERADRLRLENRLAPRRLLGTDRENFKAAIRPFAKTMIKLGVGHNNAEGDALLNQIGDTLLETGWQREDIEGATEFGAAYPDGVTVLVSPQKPDTIPAFAVVMAVALNSIGLSAEPSIASDQNLTAGQVKVAMGFKPVGMDRE